MTKNINREPAKGTGAILDINSPKHGLRLSVNAIPPGTIFPSDFRLPLVPIKDQDIVGSCVAHSIATAREIKEMAQKGYYTQLSPGFIYADRETTDFQGEGMDVLQALENVKLRGVCNFIEFPYNQKYANPSTADFPILNTFNPMKADLLKKSIQNRITSYSSVASTLVEDIKYALMTSGPVLLTIHWYTSFQYGTPHTDQPNPGVIPAPGPLETTNSDHEVCIIGWRSDNKWVIVNSYGPGWGDHGVGYLDFNYVGIYGMQTITDTIASAVVTDGSVLPGTGNWLVDTIDRDSEPSSLRSASITDGTTSAQSFTIKVPTGAASAVLRVKYKVSSESGGDYFNIVVNGSQAIHQNGAVAWTECIIPLNVGVNSVDLSYVKNASGAVYSDKANVDCILVEYVPPTTEVPDGTKVTTSLTPDQLVTAQSGNWIKDTTMLCNGAYTFRSALIGSGGLTTTSFNINIPSDALNGIVKFNLLVSSEPNHDPFVATLNGVEVIHSSGDNTWVPMALPLKPGLNTLTFTYSKDSSYDAFNDRVCIDGLTYEYIPNAAPVVNVTGVTLNKSATTLIAGGATETLVATLSPSNATNKSISFTSSNSSVATVNLAGTVTPISAGTTVITLIADQGKTATCTVTVNAATVHVTGVSLNTSSVSIVTGNTYQLTATVAPSNAINKSVAFASSNNSVAIVSPTGLVTAISVGTATVTVTTNDGSKQASCTVTVQGAADPLPTVSPAQMVSSQTGNWVIDNTTLYGGNATLRSAVITGNGTTSSTNYITIPSGATNAVLKFKYLVSSEQGYDFFTVTVNGVQMLHTSGTSITTFTEVSTALNVGTNTIVFTYSKDGSVDAGSDKVNINGMNYTYTPGSGGTLHTGTIDASNFVFLQTGDWIQDNSLLYNGAASARSKVISDNGVSSSTWTLTPPAGSTNAKLRFKYQVSSETNYDFLTVTVNGTQVLHVSGTVSTWTECVANLNPGVANTIMFTYSKDGSASSGADKANIAYFSQEYYI